VQLQVPENLRPTIYFEDSFKGEKSSQYSSYIDGISALITGYQGIEPSFRNHEQVHDFVRNMRMQTNKRVNINALDSWKQVYPILVVDSDGMNSEKIFKIIEKSICENRTPNIELAGGYEFLENFSSGNFYGKFAIIVQSDNLETCTFDGFKAGVSLSENEVNPATLGIQKITRNRYAGRFGKHRLYEALPHYLDFMVSNQKHTLSEPDKFNSILQPIFAPQTSSIYLRKPKRGLREKVKQLNDPDFERLGWSWGQYVIDESGSFNSVYFHNQDRSLDQLQREEE
tara:strand:- start:7527 stop:8381 length:855 start_codon:yes stop_codon:yes gene_type:complete